MEVPIVREYTHLSVFESLKYLTMHYIMLANNNNYYYSAPYLSESKGVINQSNNSKQESIK